MRRFHCLAMALIVVGGGSAPTPARAGDVSPALRIGMVKGMFRDVQPAMVQALSRPLRDMIHKQTGLTGDVEVLDDALVLAERMKAKQLHLGVFHGFEFAWIRKDHPEIVPLVVTIPNARKLQACVVVHQDCKATCMADLRDEPIAVPRGSKAHCWLYLERERANLPATTAKPKTKPDATPMEALDAVASGDAPAALVEISALEGYKAVSPGAFNNIKVLCQSEFFPQTVIAYRKGSVSAETAESIRRMLTEAHTTSAGKPLMMLWNLRGFEDVPAGYDAHLEKVLRAYPPDAPATTRK